MSCNSIDEILTNAGAFERLAENVTISTYPLLGLIVENNLIFLNTRDCIQAKSY